MLVGLGLWDKPQNRLSHKCDLSMLAGLWDEKTSFCPVSGLQGFSGVSGHGEIDYLETKISRQYNGFRSHVGRATKEIPGRIDSGRGQLERVTFWTSPF